MREELGIGLGMNKKEEAKKLILSLVDDFKANYPHYRKLSEADTETKLIEPLFSALGWSRSDFIKREKVRRGQKLGFADYTFKLGERTAFFLEAKKVSVSIDKEADNLVYSLYGITEEEKKIIEGSMK